MTEIPIAADNTEPFVISDTVRKEIERWLAKYPPEQRRSAVVSALLLVQEQNDGWLSNAAMDAVADYLDIPKIAVYEVVTFYDMYDLKPRGKYKINVCTNVSCMLRGSSEILDFLKKRLDIEVGETTSDGKFTLRESECLAACGGAPMCQINDQHFYENLTPKKIQTIIDQLDQQNSQQESSAAVQFEQEVS